MEKHAHAKSVQARLSHKGTLLTLQIRDDGRGFDAKEPKSGKGKWRGNALSNIHQRAMAIGGTCEAVSTPKKGTVISIQVPYKRRDKQAPVAGAPH